MWNRYGHSTGKLTVNGLDLRLGNETVASIYINEDVKMLTPTITMNFLDDKLVSGGMGIFQDGATIELTMGDGKQSEKTWRFRQWSLGKAKVTSKGNVIELSGIADLVPWMSKVITKAYKGNSSDVAKQIGQMAGINIFDIISTNDFMTWLPDGRTMGNFVRRVMDHAWMGQGSVPHMAITSQNGQWMMRIQDILKKGSGTSFASYGLAKPSSDIPIIDYEIQSHSGSLNQYTNYGHKVLQEKLNGNIDIFQNFTFNSMVKSIGINQGLSQLVRSFFHSPDSGNTFKEYAQALHQNIMGRSTFSAVVNIITDFQTTVKLMDDVTLLLAKTDGSVNEDYSGSYKITNITRCHHQGHYIEKIQCATQGSEASGGAGTGIGNSFSLGGPSSLNSTGLSLFNWPGNNNPGEQTYTIPADNVGNFP